MTLNPVYTSALCAPFWDKVANILCNPPAMQILPSPVRISAVFMYKDTNSYTRTVSTINKRFFPHMKFGSTPDQTEKTVSLKQGAGFLHSECIFLREIDYTRDQNSLDLLLQLIKAKQNTDYDNEDKRHDPIMLFESCLIRQFPGSIETNVPMSKIEDPVSNIIDAINVLYMWEKS